VKETKEVKDKRERARGEEDTGREDGNYGK
jgi:hypothetical protein